MSEEKRIQLVIARQDDPESAPYEEKFDIPYRQNMNVISALMEIRRNPVNANGEATTPVYWDMGCLEEVCGACSMKINGKPRQSCTALVDQLEQPIRLEPSKSDFIGPAAISQVRLFNAHPTGAMNKNERLEGLMGEGGLSECGNSQNCVQSCPKGIPLTTSIASMNRETTLHSFKSFFGSDHKV